MSSDVLGCKNNKSIALNMLWTLAVCGRSRLEDVNAAACVASDVPHGCSTSCIGCARRLATRGAGRVPPTQCGTLRFCALSLLPLSMINDLFSWAAVAYLRQREGRYYTHVRIISIGEHQTIR
eukprot:NODE_12422_length_1225_cov_6.306011.p3 GENE.NODE_12422_length_1225_cov_6.306011~~NODE_12422_length_1225_cov_6.306011.p3  ORF type:complete len:123 (+),score=18.26 NODE_12422_length_1225_cov_6.306011:370-738(+)